MTPLLSATTPFTAETATPDSKIEDSAKKSYNFRVVLEDQVHVASAGGIVTLTGNVANKDQKELAENTASNIPGVIRVVDQIVVAPGDADQHSDSWVAFKIRYQLLVHAHVSATDTTVKVNQGMVSLTGSADSQAQKDLTGVYAKDVDGVKSVTNDITVKPTIPSTPSPTASSTGPTTTQVVVAEELIDDASITTEVKYMLATTKSTSGIHPKVETTNGVVVISGDAHSPTEKALVTKLTEDIRGVKSVTNNMVVPNS
ncbi:MAG TPA: BON domain-containing protein [Opitutales bacterium]|jgi:hyperosmotically inducible protein|nr:BON domain-containing protein [Opitutales bacterium]